MENKENPKEEYVPRYLQQNKEIKRSWYDQFKKWTQEKSRYKTFRTNIISELHREGSKENKVHLGTLETTVPLFMVNTFVITLILTRKEGRFNMFFKSLGATCFTYLAMVFYGEERYFFQNCMRNDVVGFYLRERYLEDMKGHYYYDTLQNINNKFMSQYSVAPQADVQMLLQKIDSNLKK